MPHNPTMKKPPRPAQKRGGWAVLLFALVMSVAGTLSPAPLHAARNAAPAFELVTFSGEAYSKDSLRGHPTLLIFWAPWCNVCQRELPVLSDYYLKEKPSQLKMLSVGFADTRANVETFVKSHAGTFVYPTAYDDDRWTAQGFKINATPTAVLIDEQGMIVLIHRGAGLLRNGQFREFVATLGP